MKKFRLPLKIMFSDCDPAQIVFYPKYFQWFDVATQGMFNELGMEWSVFWPANDIAGLPIVDASAKFMGPSRMDDEIEIESWVDEWRDKTFTVRHNVINKGRVIVEGQEIRAVIVKDDTNPRGISAIPIPDYLKEKFED
jgi:4-hydroxybenzoyl-CoA thioesterase